MTVSQQLFCPFSSSDPALQRQLLSHQRQEDVMRPVMPQNFDMQLTQTPHSGNKYFRRAADR